MRCGALFFFFQAEDGIRDWTVTGVQTCALPIWRRAGRAGAVPRPPDRRRAASDFRRAAGLSRLGPASADLAGAAAGDQGRGRQGGLDPRPRSEERRVGEEGRTRWAADHLKKKNGSELGDSSGPVLYLQGLLHVLGQEVQNRVHSCVDTTANDLGQWSDLKFHSWIHLLDDVGF